jgi:hypothetical protein
LLGRWGGGVGSAEDEHVGGIVAERDAVFFKGEDDAPAQFAQNDVALVGADADLDGIGDGAAFDLVDAEDDRIGDCDVLEVGVVADLAGDVGEQGDDLVGVGARVDTDVEGSDRVVAREVGDGGDLAVGDDVESAVCVADGGASKGEVFDGALEAGEADDLADVVLVFDEDENTVEHVLEDALCAEADGDAQNAGRSEKGLVADVQKVEDLQEDDEAEDGVRSGAYDSGHGAKLGGTVEVAYLMVGAAAQALDEEQHEAMKHIDDEKDGEELRQLVLNEEDDVVVPVTLDDFDDTAGLILRGQCRKVHDYDVSLSGDAVKQNASVVCKMQFWQGHQSRWRLRGGSGDDMRILRVAMIGAVLVTAGSVRLSGGQMYPQPPTSRQGQQMPGQMPGMPQKPGTGIDPADDSNPMSAHRADQQEKLRNTDRQKRLVADTDKLLALATDLKEQVDKTNKDTMSVDVIKKAEEIEKLAHSVKERMKG